MKDDATTIRIKPLTVKAIQQFRAALVWQELDRLGDNADMESILTATVDTIVFAAIRKALGPAIPTDSAPANQFTAHAIKRMAEKQTQYEANQAHIIAANKIQAVDDDGNPVN